MGFTTTEKILVFASKKVAEQIMGGPGKILVDLHKVHFVLLGRALQEAKRDKAIQDSIEKLLDGVKKMQTEIKKLKETVPAKPEPPAVDGTPGYTKTYNDYVQAINNIAEILSLHEKNVGEVLEQTDKAFKELEKIVRSKDGTKVAGMRGLSEHYRTLDLFVLSQEMTKLNGLRSDLKRMIHDYLNH
jgi:hypothetical protein